MIFEDTYRHKGLRRQLLKILKEKGISDESLLAVIGKIPRHYFFDKALLEHAYEDKAFPIGEGQTISQPYTVAFQTQLLGIQPGDKVLEIGTGSGYQAAVLLGLGVKLFTVEFNESLFRRADKFFKQFDYQLSNFLGDGSLGLPNIAPFDKILVTAGCPAVPEPLVEQLKPGGILVIPVGDEKTQEMLKITKVNEKTVRRESFNHFSFVPLLGKFGWKK
jgi:protein-L-isoaspartate(D-aspartate) O-methyltransferase